MFQRTHHLTAIAFAISLTASISSAAAGDADAGELISTLEIHAGNIGGMQLAEDQGTRRLYLQDTYKHTTVVVDVTLATQPRIVWAGADTANAPSVQKEAGSVSISDRRGLTYSVDQNGLTIMHKRVTSATEIARDFEKRLLYDR